MVNPVNQPRDPQQPARLPAQQGAQHDSSQSRDGGSSRRIVLAGAGTVTALVLLFGYHTSTESTAAASSAVATSAVSSSTNAPSTTATADPSPATAATSGSTTSPTAASATSDSSTTSSTPSSSAATGAQGGAATTFTGDATDTRYGPVQVKITVTSGKITAVDVVEYPTGNHKDAEINARAVPTLVQETLSAQSANIDMVSGATYTSDGYLTSLQSALDQAKL